MSRTTTKSISRRTPKHSITPLKALLGVLEEYMHHCHELAALVEHTTVDLAKERNDPSIITRANDLITPPDMGLHLAAILHQVCGDTETKALFERLDKRLENMNTEIRTINLMETTAGRHLA